MAFWPAWIVAPALAALAVGYWIVLRRPLGVSGVLARFARLREELALDRAAAALESERAAIAAAAAATRAGPGPAAVDVEASLAITAEWPAPPPDLVVRPDGRTCAPTPRLAVHATFLASVAAGGLVVSIARGGFGAAARACAAQLGSAAPSVVALAAGGLLAGFGASLCGGCVAGHGLTGCGRAMPASLLATGVLFGAAVVTTLLLRSLA